MWKIAVLAVLAGCPAPPAPPTERPSPPPAAVVVVEAPDAAAEPVVPGVLAVRAGKGTLELVHVDAGGEVRVLHQLRRAAGLPRVADLAVDAVSGRYAVLVEADTVDGTATGARRNVMSLVLGNIDGVTIAVGPGDTGCVMHQCFESTVSIAPGGDTIVTTLHRSSASHLARYDVGPTPRPTKLTAKSVEKPTLSADHTRLAYQRSKKIYVVDVGSTTTPVAVAKRVTDVAGLTLGDGLVVYRTRAGALGVIDVETQAVRSVGRLAADPRPMLRVVADELLTGDGDQVVAVPLGGGDPRVIATGTLIDVSADGAWLLVDDGVLSVVATADGHTAARLEVTAAFGEVRARLAP